MNNQLSLEKEKALLIEQFSKNQKEFYKDILETTSMCKFQNQQMTNAVIKESGSNG